PLPSSISSSPSPIFSACLSPSTPLCAPQNHQNNLSIYFVGNSIVGFAIYAPDINRELAELGYNITAYNLFAEGTGPLMLLMQLDGIIESHPAAVVYGISYNSIVDDGFVDEMTILSYSRYNLSDTVLSLYTDDEISVMNTKPDLIYKSKFLISAIQNKIIGIEPVNYTGDPYGMELRLLKSAQKIPESIEAEANDPTNSWRPIVTNETNRQKEALLYFVTELQEKGIPVVFVNMPLHPLISEKITNESRQNFSDFLNETGAVWYDYERILGDESFFDSRHLSWTGTRNFTPKAVEIIVNEVENGAIHHA
nr:hypothetical protein [Methanocorpusculum sp.]